MDIDMQIKNTNPNMGIGFDAVNVTYSFPATPNEAVGHGTLEGGEIPAGGKVVRPLSSTFTAPWSVLGALRWKRAWRWWVTRCQSKSIHFPLICSVVVSCPNETGANFIRDMNRGSSDIIVRGNVKGYSTGDLILGISGVCLVLIDYAGDHANDIFLYKTTLFTFNPSAAHQIPAHERPRVHRDVQLERPDDEPHLQDGQAHSAGLFVVDIFRRGWAGLDRLIGGGSERQREQRRWRRRRLQRCTPRRRFRIQRRDDWIRTET